MLQATLWQYLGQMFGKSTLIESRGLKWGDILLHKDPKTGKERLGFKGGHSSLEEPASETLHYAAVTSYKMFQRHRPPQMNQPQRPFYLAIKGKIKYGDPIWYMRKAQAANKIGKLPKSKGRSKRQRLS